MNFKLHNKKYTNYYIPPFTYHIMKKFFIVSLSLLVIISLVESFDFHESELETEEKMWDLYERWRSHHRTSRSLEDKHKRFDVFKDNARYINDFNNKDKPYKLKLNKFADMTNQEYRSKYAGTEVRKHYTNLRTNGTFRYKDVQAPDSIDWREKGAVTSTIATDRVVAALGGRLPMAVSSALLQILLVILFSSVKSLGWNNFCHNLLLQLFLFCF